MLQEPGCPVVYKMRGKPGPVCKSNQGFIANDIRLGIASREDTVCLELENLHTAPAIGGRAKRIRRTHHRRFIVYPIKYFDLINFLFPLSNLGKLDFLTTFRSKFKKLFGLFKGCQMIMILRLFEDDLIAIRVIIFEPLCARPRTLQVVACFTHLSLLVADLRVGC